VTDRRDVTDPRDAVGPTELGQPSKPSAEPEVVPAAPRSGDYLHRSTEIELHEALMGWVDAIAKRDGRSRNAAVRVAIDELNRFRAATEAPPATEEP
jgi:hypothetical protein